jgi:hypothetical protein
MKFSTGIIASYETLNHKFDQILRWLTRLTREKKRVGGTKQEKRKKEIIAQPTNRSVRPRGPRSNSMSHLKMTVAKICCH